MIEMPVPKRTTALRTSTKQSHRGHNIAAHHRSTHGDRTVLGLSDVVPVAVSVVLIDPQLRGRAIGTADEPLPALAIDRLSSRTGLLRVLDQTATVVA